MTKTGNGYIVADAFQRRNGVPITLVNNFEDISIQFPGS